MPTLYVRIRGKVQGPFDDERLRALARRGQISRIHEVSPDGANWSSASAFPELFDQSQATAPASTSEPAATATQRTSVAANHSAANHSAPGKGWYYEVNGVEHGPVEISKIQMLLASGQILLDTLVWADGMAQWSPARHVPDLHAERLVPPNTKSSATADDSSSSPSESKRTLSPILVKTVVSSQPWLTFIVVVAYTLAALSFLGGIGELMLGSKLHNPVLIYVGLAAMLGSVLLCIGAMLLMSFNSRISRFHISKTESSLEVAMGTLKVFWTYVGILLIVCLAFLIVFIVMLISVAGAF